MTLALRHSVNAWTLADKLVCPEEYVQRMYDRLNCVLDVTPAFHGRGEG